MWRHEHGQAGWTALESDNRHGIDPESPENDISPRTHSKTSVKVNRKGSRRRALEVRDELEQVLGSSDYLDRLKTEQRYVEELW